MMAYTEAELLRIRMDCLFTYEAGRMLYVNEPWRQTVPAPLLHAGRTLEGEICYRFGQQVSPGAMSRAQTMLESGVWDADAYGKVLGGSRSKREICFWYPGKQVPAADCHALVPEEAPLLSATFPGYEEELPFASPYMACFRNGQILCPYAAACAWVRGMRQASQPCPPTGGRAVPWKPCASGLPRCWSRALSPCTAPTCIMLLPVALPAKAVLFPMPKPWKYGCKGHLSPVSHMQKGPPAPDAPGMGGLSVFERYIFAAAVFSGKMNILHCPAANHSLFFQYPGAA